MQNSFFRIAFWAAAALIFSLGPARGQDEDPFAGVEITTEQVGDGIYVLFGSGGNIGLAVGEDGTFLIDDQFAPLTAKITAAVAAVTDQPVKFLLNTHWHGDHAGGNENFGEAGAIILAHDNVRKRMAAGQFMEFFNSERPPSPDAALPVITFNSEMTLHINGQTMRVIHEPHAHTDGDSVIYFAEANVIHMGDLFFNRLYPFIDLDSGGSVQGMISGINRMLMIANGETRIIPGHGPVGDRDDLIAFRDLLSGLLGQVSALKADGMSKDEILAAGLTDDYDATWHPDGWPMAGNDLVGFVYGSLENEDE